MTAPTIKVEVALTTKPTEAASWVDISAYWRYSPTMGISRGRSTELDRVEAGSLDIALDNADRRFDPNNAAGPYYGDLLPLRRIRISATYGGETYRLFTGYIEEWGQEWPGMVDAIVPVKAVDGFKVLGLSKITASYAEQTIDARIAAVLDDASWTTGDAWVLGSASNSRLGSTTVLGPVGDRAIDTAASSVQADELTDTSALEHLQECEEIEQGVVFIDASGAVAFHNRNRRIANPDSVATFGDDGAELPYQDARFRYDDSRILNSVSVTRQGGVIQTVTDATSVSTYFKRSKAYSNMLMAGVNDNEALSLARWLVNHYKDPGTRIEELTFTGYKDDALWLHVLAREIGDRITVKRRPPGGGDPISIECHIEGIKQEIGEPGQWRTIWQLSPADTTRYWRLGDSAYSILGSSTILAH